MNLSPNLPEILTAESAKPDWLIPELLCRGAMLAVVGDAGVGKSMLCYSLAMMLATDAPQTFLGHPIARARVAYFDEENSLPDMSEYLRWIWRAQGQPDVKELSDYLRLEHFSLGSLGPLRFVHMAKVVAEHKADLVIVDTASPVCEIQDENDNAEASRAIKALRGVRSAGGVHTSMIILKHARMDHTTGRWMMRGAKAWKGELDGIVMHLSRQGHPREDGLRRTQLISNKTRAFGLRQPLWIDPERTSNGGLRLSYSWPPKRPREIELPEEKTAAKETGDAKMDAVRALLDS